MCGIAGAFAFVDSAPPVDREELLKIRERMAKRGPDGSGIWLSGDQRIGFAHRRLAIIDLSETGTQPMTSADGRLVITFNGEIYNYRDLRRELESQGRTFRSQSDTEVLLHLYAVFGEAMLAKLRGMYAFAIWDAGKQTLFLARDSFGIKPLYYACDGVTLRFASQVKALLASGDVDASSDSAGAAGFLLWGCVPEPFTLYRGIAALPAGSFLTLRRGGTPRISTHFSVRDELLKAQGEAREFSERDRVELGEHLRDAVRHHLVSDVPVGVFLSAGVDSNLVASIAAEQSGVSLRTLTLGFEEYRGTFNDEVPLAEKSASSLQAQHSTHWIRRSDFEDDLDAILAAMDQPTTDGVNAWFVCREAARDGLKVALSGLGGDELFAGYPSFRDVPRLAQWLQPAALVPSVGKMARMLLAPGVSAFTSPKYAGLFEYGGTFEGAYLLRRALFMPWELGEVLDPVAVHTGLERLQTVPVLAESIVGIRDGRARVTALELAWYLRNQLLRDADWAGMAHSVEVRTPFVDAALFRALAPWLVSGQGPTKVDAAASLRHPLSQEILDRSKSGFSIPVRDWQTQKAGGTKHSGGRGLRNWARRVLPPMQRQFRVLALVTEAYGGHGGIAKFNRDLISAIAAMPECAEVVAVPRLVPISLDPLPARVKFLTSTAIGKLRYSLAVARQAMSGPFDLVIVGHINLGSLGALVAASKRAQSALIIHGIDAWTPHRSPFVRASLRRMNRIIGVSNVTLHRFGGWAKANPERFRLLPNCVDLSRFSPGPKPADLGRSLGLEGRIVIMTFGRLASEERYKGFDEVIEVLPSLAREIPNITYLICGDGPDRGRLEAKADTLGVRDRVVFAGYVPEQFKADYYRLADAYVMPSRGEGFGIVFLEALSCGLPAVGSTEDGGREALLDGVFGTLVNPGRPDEVRRGIVSALSQKKMVHPDLRRFSAEAFAIHAASIAREMCSQRI